MDLKLIELTTKEEMLDCYELLTEVYPSLTKDAYDKELDVMIPNNYGQVAVYDQDRCVGLSGFWIGSKLWCGKYLECDNVVVALTHRRMGIAQMIFDRLSEKAKEENCSMMALDSYTDNFEAHKFFYKEGFVPRGFHFINILDKSMIR